MKKKDSTFWNMLWSLTLITAVAGGLLGYTHRLTQEPIARAAKAGREKAIQQVIPKYNNSPIDEQCSYTCLLYTSPSPRDISGSRMPSSA